MTIDDVIRQLSRFPHTEEMNVKIFCGKKNSDGSSIFESIESFNCAKDNSELGLMCVIKTKEQQ